MSKINKLKKQILYRERQKEQYNKFYDFKIGCSICGWETNLYSYEKHLTQKRCKVIQMLKFKPDDLENELLKLKCKIFFIKFGCDEIDLSNSLLSNDEIEGMMKLKDELNNSNNNNYDST